VSQDVEEQLIRACVRELDTTLITITHRPHLKKYHQVAYPGQSIALINVLTQTTRFLFFQFELYLTKNNGHTFTKVSSDHQ